MGMSENRKDAFPGRYMRMYGHLVGGSKVEVTSKEAGFQGSWFSATVVTPPEVPGSRLRKRRMALVEYDTLVSEDGAMLLRESVDSELLRPVPPPVSLDGGFAVGYHVDAFEKDGWWSGVVVGLVEATEGGERYLVWFEESEAEAEVEFGKEELRLHLDWKYGKWFLFRNEERQELLVKSDGFVYVSNSSCSSDPIEVIELDKSVPLGFNADLCAETMPLNEQSAPLSRQLSPCSSNRCHREMTGLDCPNSSSTQSYPTKKLKRKCTDDSLVHDKGTLKDSMKEESDETAFCLRPALTLSDNGANPLRDCQIKNGDDPIKYAFDEKDDASSHAETSMRREECVNKINDFVAAGELQEANDVHRKSFMEEQPLEAIGTESTDEGQGTFQTRSISCNQLSLDLIEPHFGALGKLQEAIDVDRKTSIEEQPLEAIGTESTDEGQGTFQARSMSCNQLSLELIEPHFAVLGELQEANDVNRKSPMEEQPLEAIGTESTDEGQGYSHLVKNDGMSTGREGTLIGLSEWQQTVGDDVVEMNQSLPFVKRSPIWKFLETVEIFQKFPQKPHFLPLLEARERTREGCAIGEMVTFASTIDDATKLSVNDPASAFTDCLETLRLLELHGFDVKMVERRLMKLLSLKDQQQKMDKTKNEVERQISELTHKRVKLAADIDETNHKIKFYKRQLALAFMEEEEVDREILIWETCLDVMDTVMRGAMSSLVD